MQISGSVFLVTGASSGLGAAAASELVGAGANVVLADTNTGAGRELEQSLGSSVRFVETDVTDTKSVEAAIAIALSLGPLRGAINCAGVVHGERTVGKRGPHDLEAFDRVIRINLSGTFNVVRLAAASMAAQEPVGGDGERGVIINTASVAAFDGQIGQAAYAASKGGIVGMTLPLARDLSRNGIRVVAIAPGIFETPMMASMSEEVRGSLASQIPFPSRLGKPSEFASLCLHIIHNVMLNGEVIRLDGAVRMAPR